MAKTEAYTCDVCGATTKDPSKWIRAVSSIGGHGSCFFVGTWDDEAVEESNIYEGEDCEKHYCSEKCTMQALSKSLFQGE
jgi:hypothetical protein